MRKTIAVAAALSITLGACSSHSSPKPEASLDLSARIDRIRSQGVDATTVFASFLKPVGNCDALLAHIHAEAAARVGPYGLPGYGNRFGGAVAMNGTGATAAATSGLLKTTPAAPTGREGTGDAGSSTPFSGTNNQEDGVDEPDVVKTDGRRIVTLTANRLNVVEVTGGASGVVRTVAIGDGTFTPSELLIVGDRALIFGTGYDQNGGGFVPMPAARFRSIMPYGGGGGGGGGAATVTEVNLAGTGAPQVGSTLRVDGAYLTGRMVGSTVRMVVRSEPRDLEFVTPQNKSGEDRARKSNEEVVLDSTIDDWLPSYTLLDAKGDKVAGGLLADCANVDAPTEFAGFGSLSVLTFDASKPLTAGGAVTILAGGKTVYASDASLYVATETWIDPEQQSKGSRRADWERTFSTSVHQFSIDGTKPAVYVASGTVPGHLLNQFSLSEHKGVLRVASTKGTPWNTQDKSESLITTLKRSGDALAQVGQVGDMGRGERIYSVRFAGDVAYLVTFRQTDPFYTVDLRDPGAPAVLGELKITGYSGYLHPIGDNLVIGVGQEASTQGRVQGAKVSLFDVRDLARPQELAKWTNNAFGQTGVEWDHHAFLYWPDTKTLVLPLMEYGRGDTSTQFFGAIVLQVDRTGITEVGRVSHGTEKPANLGASTCRKLTDDEVRMSSGVDYPRGDRIALVCESGQVGGAIGYQCYPFSNAQVQANGATLTVPKGGHVEFCTPTWNQPSPIQRSLVIGNTLWTLSQQRLQANTLATLARTARVEL